jgi:hypothetical protein
MQACTPTQGHIYDWLKHSVFRGERKRPREAVVERALDRLKANTALATETLVKHLESGHETSPFCRRRAS